MAITTLIFACRCKLYPLDRFNWTILIGCYLRVISAVHRRDSMTRAVVATHKWRLSSVQKNLISHRINCGILCILCGWNWKKQRDAISNVACVCVMTCNLLCDILAISLVLFLFDRILCIYMFAICCGFIWYFLMYKIAHVFVEQGLIVQFTMQTHRHWYFMGFLVVLCFRKINYGFSDGHGKLNSNSWTLKLEILEFSPRYKFFVFCSFRQIYSVGVYNRL